MKCICCCVHVTSENMANKLEGILYTNNIYPNGLFHFAHATVLPVLVFIKGFLQLILQRLQLCSHTSIKHRNTHTLSCRVSVTVNVLLGWPEPHQ